MSAIIECENRIAEIYRDKEKERGAIQQSIAEAEEAIAAHDRELEEAICRGDEEAYSRIRKAREATLDSLEVRKRRLSQLDDKALITREEYESLVSGIMGECRRITEANKQTIAGLASQIGEIGESEKRILQRANIALHELQENVYKNEDRPRFPNGNLYPNTEKRINDYSVCEYARVVTGSGYYAMFKGLDTTGPQPVVLSSEESRRKHLESLPEEMRERMLKAEEREKKARKGGVYGIW